VPTTNRDTINTRKHQLKNIAAGLCRFCTLPLSEDSVQLCDYHLEKQRQYGRLKTGGLPHGYRRNLVVESLKQMPDIDPEVLASTLGMSKSYVIDQGRAAGLIPHRPISERRRQIAAVLAANPTAKFTHVAAQVGVSSDMVSDVAKGMGITGKKGRPKTAFPFPQSILA